MKDKIMILSSIKTGISQTWQNKRMALIYYLANLFFGIILMLPFRSMLSKFIGTSLMGEKLAGRLDLDFLFEFIKENPNFFSTYTVLFLALGSRFTWFGGWWGDWCCMGERWGCIIRFP
jgi:hypothetical protein